MIEIDIDYHFKISTKKLARMILLFKFQRNTGVKWITVGITFQFHEDQSLERK